MRITPQRMIGVLGKAPKPEKVWEKQFDYNDKELAKLAEWEWNEIPEGHLWYYFHDMSYVELQPDLFRHVFPACLKFWYESLMRNESAERGDTEFHYALMRGNIVEKFFNEKQKELLWRYFSDGLLDRIDEQKDFSLNRRPKDPPPNSLHLWIWRFNSLGIVAPIIRPIWEQWWNLDNQGKALCAILYLSGLIYTQGENPIYGKWTPERGGGGPYLSEDDSHMFDWTWREDNLNYLKSTLSVDYIFEKLEIAVRALSSHPDLQMAERIASEAKTRSDIIAIQIDDLIENLAQVQTAKKHWR